MATQKTAMQEHKVTTETNPEESLMDIVITAASGVTKKQNAERKSEMKNTETSTQTVTAKDETTEEMIQEITAITTATIPETNEGMTAMTNRSTTRNWSAKYAVIPDTQQRIAISERKGHLLTGTSHMTNRTSEKTMNFEENSNVPETTQRMS